MPRRRVALTIPYGVVGLAAGFVLQARAQEAACGERLAVVLLTALFALAVGGALSKRMAAAEMPWSVALVPVPMAGAIEGALLALATWGRTHSVSAYPDAVFRGGALGAVVALAFVPPFALVILAAKRVGTARAGSLIDGAHRRGVWVATAVASAAAVTVAYVLGIGVDDASLLVAVSGCTLVLATAFFVDVDATVKLVRYRPGRVRPGAPLVVDYGIGDEVEEREGAAVAAYRESARTVVVFRGTRPRARAALLRATLASGAGFALVTTSAVVAFVR